MKVSIESVYERLKPLDLTRVALACRLEGWTESENGQKVTRWKLPGRADGLQSGFIERLGISTVPIDVRDLFGERNDWHRLLFETDACIVCSESLPSGVNWANKIEDLGFSKPIFVEVLEDDARSEKALRMAARYAVERDSPTILNNLVYLTVTRPSPRSVVFPLIEIKGNGESRPNHSRPLPTPATPPIIEGKRRFVLQTRVERSRPARRECLKHHGHLCFVCGINFAERYKGCPESLVHVHHLKEISKLAEEREVDPVNDLRPICPNCHAVIHSRTPMFSIDDVREMLCK